MFPSLTARAVAAAATSGRVQHISLTATAGKKRVNARENELR
jgi:hypothetical protein